MCNLLGIEFFSKCQVDKFESRTDLICINHGLGYQLLDWSKSIRENLKVVNWRGAENIDSKSKILLSVVLIVIIDAMLSFFISLRKLPKNFMHEHYCQILFLRAIILSAWDFFFYCYVLMLPRLLLTL